MAREKRYGLARVLSKMGRCSRSEAAQLIRGREIRVNGRIATDPEMPIRMGVDRVEVAGAVLTKQSAIYLAMNKPRGIVTTASDEQGRSTVYDLLPGKHTWVAPVGRLDKASEGLLLLTNDSEWAARITDPASHLPKTYHVQIDRVPDDQLMTSIATGVNDGGDILRAVSARVLRKGRKNSWLEIALDEGKNRHIRRLLGCFGIEVLRLVRVSIGPLQLGELKKGAVRPLSPAEKESLDLALKSGKRPPKNSGRMPIDVG